MLGELFPGLAEHGIRILGLDDHLQGPAQGARRALPAPDLPGPHAARRRPGPPVSRTSRACRCRWPRSCATRVERRATFARVKVPTEMLAALRRARRRRRTRSSRSRRSSRPTSRRCSPGWRSSATRFFRVTRDADFEVSDEADDLLQAVEAELRRRRFGEAVRLEVGVGTDAGVLRAAHARRSTSRNARSTTSTGCSDSSDAVADLRPARLQPSCATRRGRRSPSRACRARSPST